MSTLETTPHDALSPPRPPRSADRDLPGSLLSPRALPFLSLTLLALAAGLIRAAHLRWACDDAFISFRYVENWLGGHGLVYNPGERVEGYTHFLWLCLLAFWQKLGSDPVAASQVLGLAASTLCIALCAWTSLRFSGRLGTAIPLAGLALACHYDYAVWATGGLETSFFACQILLAFLLMGTGPPPGSGRLAGAGLLLAMIALTRPDGLIFGAGALAFLLLDAGRRSGRRARTGRQVLFFLVPYLGVLLLYLGWKISYYGQIFPNTYYAKSAGDSYWSQGFRYLWLYFRAYLSSLLFLLAFPALFLHGRTKGAGGRSLFRADILDDPWTRPLLLGLLWILGYLLLFVCRVGGDFMYARFLIPLVPLFYLTAEIALRRLLAGRTRLLVPVLLVLPLLVAGEKTRRDSIYFDREGNPRSSSGPHNVSDEHWYYTHKVDGLSLSEALREMGRQLRPCFEGTQARVLLRGQATMGYYAHFAYCLDESGLTDPVIAHLPLERRGRPGHEKTAPMDYLVRRGINFLFLKKPYREEPYRFAYFRFGSRTVRAEMMTYDPVLLGRLKDRLGEAFRFTDFPAYLDEWLAGLGRKNREQVREEYAAFRDFYFSRNLDREREGRITAYLNGGGG